ncbi:hypothetical protein WAK64_10840 [Bacillus spongiae]|uniref:Right handed beta helix domain-containing protein n=1 Tax=Bacillus spongiae TaxID=2683610 RepID=A0ABU8HDY4_9BACI
MVFRIVPTMFPNVQDAIDASSEGDSIKILAGKFDGFEVDVDNLKIFGCGIGRTIIEGAPSQGSSNGVAVNANRIILQAFTVQGFTGDGVFVESGNNNVLKDIESRFNGSDGFDLRTDNNLIINCVASFHSENETGFQLTSLSEHTCIITCNSFRNGTGYQTASGVNNNGIGNKFISNIAKENSVGVDLDNLNGPDGFNTFIKNKVFLNNTGFRIDVNNNNVINNIVCNNAGNGYDVGISDNNIIDSNIVRNNGTDVTDAGTLVNDGATSNTIRFNKARNNIEFDIEALGNAFNNNTFDGNQCGSSDPPSICDS